MPTHVELDSPLLIERAQDHGSPIDETVTDALLLYLVLENPEEMLADEQDARDTVDVDGELFAELVEDHGGSVTDALADAMMFHISTDNADEMFEHIHEQRGVVRGA